MNFPICLGKTALSVLQRSLLGFFLTELEIEIRISFCRFQVFFNHFLNQTVIGEKFEESVLIVQHLFADYF